LSRYSGSISPRPFVMSLDKVFSDQNVQETRPKPR
jgi:hypothetical protein